jgi:cytoskeletal protein RodZ
MSHPSAASLAVALRFARPGVAEAVAVAGEIADSLAVAPRRGGRIVVPSFGDVRLQADGNVTWAYGRETRPEDAARAVARLLARLLLAAEQAGGRVPAALKHAVGRALDEQAPVPLASLAELRSVLDRFGPDDRRGAVATLAQRTAAVPRPALGAQSTIADVRRARRESGVTLASISGSTGIPMSLLRELEWGLFDDWRGGASEEAVRAYAQAAGLDADAVVAIVAPHLGRAPSGPRVVRVAMTTPRRPRTGRARRHRLGSVALVFLALALVTATLAWLMWMPRESQAGSVPSRLKPNATNPSHAAAQPAHPAATRPHSASPAATPAPRRPSPPRATRPPARPSTSSGRPEPAEGRRVVRTAQTRAGNTTIWNRPLLILKLGKQEAENPNEELRIKN